MTPRSSPLGCVPLQSPAPSPGPAKGSAVLGFTFATEPKETDTHSFLLPKLGAVMNSHHGFPKPQRPEHLPEQAVAFPQPCPSQPISWRHSVPQPYSGKCSLSLRLPVLSGTTGLGARLCHSTSLLLRVREGKPPVFSEEPGPASKAQRKCPNKLTRLPPGRAGHWEVNITRRSYLWAGECAEKSRTKWREREQRVRPRPGQASKGAAWLPGSKPTQAQPLRPAEIPRETL